MLIALAASLLALSSPRAAQAAGCAGHSGFPLDQMLGELASLSGNSNAILPPLDHPVAPPRGPCRGASCSGRSSDPALPSSIDPSRTRIDRWPALLFAPPVIVPGSVGLDASKPDVRPIDRNEPVDRPPRRVS